MIDQNLQHIHTLICALWYNFNKAAYCYYVLFGGLMMKNKNFLKISFLLVLLTALPVVSACGDKALETETNVQNTPVSDSVVTENSERAQYAEYAPVVEDLNQYEYRIMCEEEDDTYNNQVLYDSDEATADTLNDAIYYRNLAVEEAYNCTITLITQDDVESFARKAVMAGLDFTDLLTSHNVEECGDMAATNYLLDLKSLPELCLEAPWWDDSIEELSIFGKQYITTGSITIRDDIAMMCVLYSKKLATDFDIENLYEHVLNGTWSWDLMKSLCKDIYNDLDGDGVMGMADRYGVITHAHGPFWMAIGANMQTVIYNEADETYTSNWMSDDVYNKLNEYVDFFVSNPGVIISNGKKAESVFGDDSENIENVFRTDRALFWADSFGNTIALRDSESDFGLLPIPKWDEQQEEYCCPVTGDSYPLCMPNTIENQHAAALITEALAYESMFTLSPAFYDVFLDEKILRDEESLAVVDLMFASKKYDFDWHLDITELDMNVKSMVQKSKNSLVSTIASAERKSQNALNKYVAKYRDLDCFSLYNALSVIHKFHIKALNET